MRPFTLSSANFHHLNQNAGASYAIADIRAAADAPTGKRRDAQPCGYGGEPVDVGPSAPSHPTFPDALTEDHGRSDSQVDSDHALRVYVIETVIGTVIVTEERRISIVRRSVCWFVASFQS